MKVLPLSKIHFIPHVHWDREWLRSTDSSRIKLVYFYDRLIEMLENDPQMKYFTFDGQTAALEDYLAIKESKIIYWTMVCSTRYDYSLG